MANQQGFSLTGGAGSVAKILKHYDRSKLYDDEGNLFYSQYPNLTQRGYKKSYNQSDIDASRTYLNYNLAPEREGGQQAFIERRLSEIYVHKNALKNGLVDWVVTLPDMEQYEGREREFFEHAYDALAKKYGEKNVVSAYVHMDEAQPHMHFAFIPVVPDLKHEQGWKLSKKGVNLCERTTKDGKKKIDTADFSRQFHTYLDKFICEQMNLERSGVSLTEEQREKRKIKKNMDSVPELKEAVEQLEKVEEKSGQALETWKVNVAAANREYDRWEQNKAAADKAAEMAQKLPELEARVNSLEEQIKAQTGVLEAQSRQIKDNKLEISKGVAELKGIEDATNEAVKRHQQAESAARREEGRYQIFKPLADQAEKRYRDYEHSFKSLSQIIDGIHDKLRQVVEIVDSFSAIPFWGSWQQKLTEIVRYNPLAQRILNVGNPWDSQRDGKRAEKQAKKEIKETTKSLEQDIERATAASRALSERYKAEQPISRDSGPDR